MNSAQLILLKGHAIALYGVHRVMLLNALQRETRGIHRAGASGMPESPFSKGRRLPASNLVSNNRSLVEINYKNRTDNYSPGFDKFTTILERSKESMRCIPSKQACGPVDKVNRSWGSVLFLCTSAQAGAAAVQAVPNTTRAIPVFLK